MLLLLLGIPFLIPFWNLRDLLACLFLQRNFLRQASKSLKSKRNQKGNSKKEQEHCKELPPRVLLLLLGIPFLIPFWNLRDLLACLFLQRNFLGGVFLGGVSWLAIPCFPFLGKNCLGGLTWLESAGFFLPQQDLPGWGFVSGNSLVSRCVVVEVPCSAPAPSWNSLFDSFLEFKGFAGLPLSAEKFPRWSFWLGHPGWQFFPFLCVGNQILGGVSWVGHPGNLVSFWWKFSDRWNYLARNCWRLSSSRLTWKWPSGHRDVSKQLLERPKMWSAVRWHRGYMYQRINDCYVFFIAFITTISGPLLCDTGDIKYLGGNLCGILCVILCEGNSHWAESLQGIQIPWQTAEMKLLENYAKSLVENHGKALVENHGNTLSKARKKNWWNIMQHYFGRKPMDTPWWKTMGHSDWETMKTFGGKQRKSIGGQQRKTAVGKLQTKWWKTWKTIDNIWWKATEKQYPLTFD